jgi:hypothetical protein
MSVTGLVDVHVPPATAVWIDRVMWVFVALLVLWVVLKLIGYAMRRSYNLTPVGTAGSRNVKPDFLAVDHAGRKQMIERGREFDRVESSGLAKALTVTNVGVVASGLVSFVSAAFLAFGRIEELDTTWRNLSAKDRFVAIVQSHPVGFALALVMIVAAFARLAMTFRTSR